MQSEKYKISVILEKLGLHNRPETFKGEDVTIDIRLNSSWIEYRDNWNGTMLISIKGYQIILTDEYVKAMKSKGNHPLAQVYPKFLERRNSVEEKCRKIQSESNYLLNTRAGDYFMRFNDDYEVLNCVVPKAGSHIWAIKFASMLGYEGKLKYSKFNLFEYLSPPLDTARRVQTYTKFFVYRHPFERLVSGYCSKFSGNNFYLAARYAKDIITVNYLEDKSKAQMSLDEQEIKKQEQRIKLRGRDLNITFLEFVTWVASFLDRDMLKKLNPHWSPITQLCNPCMSNYDILIDHDFIAEESQILVDYLQKNNESNIPIYFEKYPRTATREKCNEYFRDIPHNLREKLHQIFLNDFILYGYTYNGDSQDYACSEGTPT
ncbi:Carbohydrate sulfotransferase 8-like [Oopsacas minuta]|uniref:Carbohydrate sulfotransferase n=1 Tax=Oopsacas minuta TaxID=111878 RepID=A0AAV7JMK3_9METZ|nr:Carbohydrate sulfotransferase 8-like [Oopsacas minuta]